MSVTGDEFALIEWFRRHAPPHARLKLGIGDDAAVVAWTPSSDALLTVDMLMEGVHFTIPPATPQQVGRKALAVNLSDIAAMGGRPIAAVISLALPRGGAGFATRMFEGIQELACEFDVAIAGGDTNSWNGPLVIDVTVVGEVAGRGPVRRDGAQVGDWIMTTGSFGGSLSGKHLSFQPRVREALELQRQVTLHAMIDVSDGLSLDLHRMLQASSVGAILDQEAIPISAVAGQLDDGKSPLEHALGDGEDFELLFAVAAEDGHKLLQQPPFDVPLSRIGEIVAGSTCQLRVAGGKLTPLPPLGWEHVL